MMEKYSPRLSAHLKKYRIDSSLFVNHWFITLYSYDFPLEVVVRIWDVVILERDLDFLLKVALYLMKQVEGEVIALGFEDVIGFFRHLPNRLPPTTEMILQARSISLDARKMRKLETEFEKTFCVETIESSE
eukprot:TRINITY_DN5770_c0_g2_i3.p1 TRINITY_DN5770_c0_g2~~TRINITY_DN5770_c0_g2_i3.p1  ORF type:complete len:132 (-),score=30.42 TRINITY_DN5770_c0_g2_i3:292-687(-)